MPDQNDKDDIIGAVNNAMMAFPHPLQNYALAYHPPSKQKPWMYTRTVYCMVQVPSKKNLTVSVRGHLHYTYGENDNWTCSPGRMWISGVEDYDFPTPQFIVQKYNGVLSLEERQAAVNYYNDRHDNNIPIPQV
ncbi:MAG: hypothetical protein ACPGJS_15235 [Flammeovirgaceae bacterium]